MFKTGKELRRNFNLSLYLGFWLRACIMILLMKNKKEGRLYLRKLKRNMKSGTGQSLSNSEKKKMMNKTLRMNL